MTDPATAPPATSSESASEPILTPNTVFFVGNGVMRVAPLLCRADPTDQADLAPSWADYMLDLWKTIKNESPDYIDLDEFSRLVGPRQAEWFDRLFKGTTGNKREAPAYRMHLLGKILHRGHSVVSNDMLQELTALIVDCAAKRGREGLTADVITTNVDCVLEQNIAATLDEWQRSDRAVFGEALVESVVDFRTSALWRRVDPAGELTLHVRIWKVHGCLRDLKLQLMAEDPDVVKAVLDADRSSQEFCGGVPTHQLATDLDAGWTQTASSAKCRHKLSGAFSQSEYFDNLDVVVRYTQRGAFSQLVRRALGRWTANLLSDYCELLHTRPLIFVGYSIPEVDVDVIYALHRHRHPGGPQRWQLSSDTSLSSTERLRQLGIRLWQFTVPAIGSAAVPGKLTAAARHEWRTIVDDDKQVPIEDDWRRAIQGVSTRAWREPQLQKLISLKQPGQIGGTSPRPSPGHRLVVAGLGSIWHGFALLPKSHFPTARRASAQMVSVDQQVPGGSGLVPVVIAAAMAGPLAVGRFAFFSNVPGRSSGWAAIQDLCQSAGIETHPWHDSHADKGSRAVGRTSHIIFFDANQRNTDRGKSRQRFIMDVQFLADERSAPTGVDWYSLRVPAAQPTDRFQQDGQQDFLFTDKEADPQTIKDWHGPTVYETGTTGLDLVTVLGKQNVQPTIWTAGIGSFIRTMAQLADPPVTTAILDRGADAVLDHIRRDRRLATLFDHDDEAHHRYLAKMIGYGHPGIWDIDGVGFYYDDEETYSEWLRDHWSAAEPAIWELLETTTTGTAVLGKPDARIGGGLLTTIHEGGLMALWQFDDHGHTRRERIVVTSETNTVEGVAYGLEVTCTLIRESPHPPPERVVIRIDSGSVVLKVDGKEESFLGTDPIRRNSLAAGDTVRGAMAYGLWAAAYDSDPGRPVDIPRILLASAALAALKCYAGSFVDFLHMMEQLRGKPAWHALWATTP
jgi:hypothetical protein